MKDKSGNVLFSKNVVSYARKMGWYDGKDEDFSFCNTYAFPDWRPSHMRCPRVELLQSFR